MKGWKISKSHSFVPEVLKILISNNDYVILSVFTLAKSIILSLAYICTVFFLQSEEFHMLALLITLLSFFDKRGLVMTLSGANSGKLVS